MDTLQKIFVLESNPQKLKEMLVYEYHQQYKSSVEPVIVFSLVSFLLYRGELERQVKMQRGSTVGSSRPESSKRKEGQIKVKANPPNNKER